MSQHRVPIAIGFLLGTVLALLFALLITGKPGAQLGYGSDPEPVPTPNHKSTHKADNTPAPFPTLSEAQRQRAIDIALKNSHVQDLIENNPHYVKKVIVWGDSQFLVGADVIIGFDTPQTITGTWLADSRTCAEVQRERLGAPVPKPFPPGAPYLATFKEVSSVSVDVDFQDGKVKQINPFDAVTQVGAEVYPTGTSPPGSCGD